MLNMNYEKETEERIRPGKQMGNKRSPFTAGREEKKDLAQKQDIERVEWRS